MKSSIIALATAATFAAAFTANADTSSPEWTYLQAGYAQLDVDGADEEPDGFGVEGSYLFNENVFVRGRYQKASEGESGYFDDWYSGTTIRYNYDADIELASIALGYKTALNDFSDFYATASVERLKVSDSETVVGYNSYSDSYSETGYGASVGIKSRLSDMFELYGEAGYLKLDDFDISDASFEAGANLYFTENFGAGVSYRKFDDVGILGANIRYAF